MPVIDINMPDLQQTYMLEYMLSVMQERAVPDIRDGFKPIQRYIVYDSFTQGYLPNKAHAKCAMTVGSVIGKYSPHSDMSTYDALSRLAQPFTNNVPVIDGHGNLGTINGDSPAAYRYTESRLSHYGLEFCENIKKNAVDFVPNYSNTLKEPTVLPAKVCNVLVQGSFGIANGFVSRIPPHNIGDVCDATIRLIKNPDLSIKEIVSKLKPDFPTGGIICNTADLLNIYETGTGVIRIRTNATINRHKNGKSEIIIPDVPYLMTIGPRIKAGCSSDPKKSGLINSIVSKITDGTIDGISDIKEQSNKFPDVKIVIEVKKDYDPEVVLQQLYKYTKLSSTFPVSLVCLNDKRFKLYNIKDILTEFIDFRRTTLRRIKIYDINILKKRIHILAGLIIAHGDIDEVINIIKKSANDKEAEKNLKKKFPDLTTTQIEYILGIRLSDLTSMKMDELKAEKKDKEKTVDNLREELKEENIDREIIEEQLKCKEKYATPIKTDYQNIETDVSVEDTIPKEDCLIVLTLNNYVKRLKPDKIKIQKRNTKGNNTDNDDTKQIISTNTKEHLLCFTNTGRVFDIKVYQIAECNSIKNKGMRLPLNLKQNEKIVSFLCVSDEKLNDHSHLMFITKNGYGKKTPLSEFKNINSSGIIAIDLKDDDGIVFVGHLDDDKKMQDIIIGTEKGQVVRYDTHEEFKPIGRSTMGNTVIKLVDDNVASACIIDSEDSKLLFVTKNGLAKVTLVTDMTTKKDPNTKKMVNINDGFPRLKRSSNIKGRIGISLKNDKLASIIPVIDQNNIVVITTKKVLGVDITDFVENPLKRPTTGKRLINISEDNDYIVATTLM